VENNTFKKEVKTEELETQKYMSDEVGEIVQAIARATLEMPIPEKSKRGNRGAYSDLEDYLKCCKKTLAKHGIIIHQHPRYLKAGRIMFSMLLHTSGQWLLASDLVNPDPKTIESAQAFQHAVSSVFTYAKRRMLQSQLGLGCDEEE